MPKKAKDEKEVNIVEKVDKKVTKKPVSKNNDVDKINKSVKKTTKSLKSVEDGENHVLEKKTKEAKVKKTDTKKLDTAKSNSKKVADKIDKKEPTSKAKKDEVSDVKVKNNTKKKTTKKTTTAKKTVKESTKPTDSKGTTVKSTTKKSTTKKSANNTKKKTTAKTTKNLVSEKVKILEYYDLPYRYNQTVVKILAQTQNILFVYWDIANLDRDKFTQKYGDYFFNDTYPILLIKNKTMNYTYEVPINDFANSWYLQVNDANCEYYVELGRKGKENYYYYVTSSNNLSMPNDHILFEKLSNNVLFKNVQTKQFINKAITDIPYLKSLSKLDDFYKKYKELFNEELTEDGIRLNMPSSHTSSNFK